MQLRSYGSENLEHTDRYYRRVSHSPEVPFPSLYPRNAAARGLDPPPLVIGVSNVCVTTSSPGRVRCESELAML